jgi:hypothetical protein
MNLHHIVLTLWRARISCFLPVWFCVTASTALLAPLFVRESEVLVPGQRRIDPMELKAGQMSWSRSDWLAALVFSLFMAFYIALTMKWEDFAYYGNDQFTCFTLMGRNYPPPIWTDAGRFEPLTLQEFNLTQYLGSNITAYFAYPILQLLIVSIILLKLDTELKFTARVCLAACLLVTMSVLVSFGGLIYPERNVVFWFLCLLFSVKRFDQTHSNAMAIAAVVSAQFMLYYKETAFVLLWGLIAGRLLLRCWNTNRTGWNWTQLREKTSRLDLYLALLGLIFLLYYAVVMFRHTHLMYIRNARREELVVLGWYLKTDLLAFLFVIIVMVRAYRISRGMIAPSVFWDGLALGGVAYFIAFCFLSMYNDYYMAPVDVIAVLYLGRLVFLSWKELGLGGKTACATVICLVLIQTFLLSTISEYYRKNLIHAKSEIASVVLEHHQGGAKTPQRLFFPFASPGVIMEFGGYLRYRGLPIESARGGPTFTNSVPLVGLAITNDGPLVTFEDILGHPDREPRPGDLVVALPDDDASFAQVASFLQGENTIFSYAPSPHLPRWLSLIGHKLYVPSPILGEPKTLSDHWLSASVTEWKQPAGGYPGP